MADGVLEGVPYETVYARIAEIVRIHARGVVKALLFGSVARREAQETSDIDLLLVWPTDMDEDDQWEASREAARRVDRATQRLCFPLICTEDEYSDFPRKSPHLAEALSQDGIDLMRYSE